MKIRIWINDEPLEITADQFIIDKNKSLASLSGPIVTNIFYVWEKIEAMPDA